MTVIGLLRPRWMDGALRSLSYFNRLHDGYWSASTFAREYKCPNIHEISIVFMTVIGLLHLTNLWIRMQSFNFNRLHDGYWSASMKRLVMIQTRCLISIVFMTVIGLLLITDQFVWHFDTEFQSSSWRLLVCFCNLAVNQINFQSNFNRLHDGYWSASI